MYTQGRSNTAIGAAVSMAFERQVSLPRDQSTQVFALPVDGLRIEDSSSFLELQIADLIAGAACEVMSSKVRNRSSDYVERLLEAGLLDATAGGIWPSSVIDLEELGTKGPALRDAADFISEIVGDHKRRGETESA